MIARMKILEDANNHGADLGPEFKVRNVWGKCNHGCVTYGAPSNTHTHTKAAMDEMRSIQDELKAINGTEWMGFAG